DCTAPPHTPHPFPTRRSSDLHKLADEHRQLHFRGVEFNLGLREQIGQLGFVAALSGFRSLVADVLFIQAHVAWERTEWGRVLLRSEEHTSELQSLRHLVCRPL